MISIIVPIYNSEKWITKCIESLINQTYKDIEILLINDGSKDNSLKICKEYENKDNRIKVIDKINEGVSKTRNSGINKASGEFIQFVDSDDYLEPDACEKLYNSIKDYDMVICGLKVWKNNVLLRTPNIGNVLYTFKDDINNYFDLRKINLGPCNKLYRKEKITNYFHEDISLGEDTLFVLDYMKNIKTVNVISDCLYNVSLDNDNSLNRKSKLDKLDSLLEQRKIEESFLTEVYGESADLTKMYNLYLSQLHSIFLYVINEAPSNALSYIKKYVGDSFLQDKVKKSAPERIDYKAFKSLFLNKQKTLILLYFKIKNILLRS